MRDTKKLRKLYTLYQEKKCSSAELIYFIELLYGEHFDTLLTGNVLGGPQQQIETKAGEFKKFRLSDGTTVTLGPESYLIYPDIFKGGQRFVSLKGEASFDIDEQKDYPFMVSTGDVSIKVNSGNLSVVLLEDQNAVRIGVSEGKAMVSLKTETRRRRYTVPAGQEAWVNLATWSIRKKLYADHFSCV